VASMKNLITKFFSNGGKRDIFYVSLIATMLVSLLKVSASFGEYKIRFEQVEAKVGKVTCIEQDVKEIKNDILWIKMYIKGEIR
jgi:hypothetical protein